MIRDYKIEVKCEIWDSHGSEDFNVGHLGCNTVWTNRQIAAVQRNILFPSLEVMLSLL